MWKLRVEMMDANKEESKESYDIRSYREGDENHILTLFNSVFSQNRSIEHWRWKFQENPFGKYNFKTCWHENRLLAQYAGCPVLMEWNGKKINTQQIVDSMTGPDFRSMVLGRRGLFIRTSYAFINEYGGCEDDKIQIMYGFNTGRIQKLGRLLLGYNPVSKVTLLVKELNKRNVQESTPMGNLIHYIQSSPSLPDHVDCLWLKCRMGHGLEIVRNYEYLKWRYEMCPDVNYTFWTLHNRFTKNITCLIVTRVREGIGYLVDFLCVSKKSGMVFIFNRIEQSFLKMGIKRIELWIPEYHPFFVFFQRHGYRLEVEPNDLSVICRSYSPDIDIAALKTEYFYTMGDSDLF